MQKLSPLGSGWDKMASQKPRYILSSIRGRKLFIFYLMPTLQPLCDNHDDSETQALILCDKCGNLCGECDRVLHYSRGTRDHTRQV